MRDRQISFCFILLFPIFISIASLHAQENLISNPGFEENVGSKPNVFCDDTKEGNFFIKGWTHPSKGCPDYWDTTGTLFPDKDFDSTRFNPYPAHSGKGCVGLTLYTPDYLDNDWDDYIDFMQSELIKPMKKDSTYYLEFYVCLDKNGSYYANNIGALFSVDPIQAGTSPLNAKPQVCLSTSSVLSSQGWNKVSGYFTAEEDYRYMTVGTFHCENGNIWSKEIKDRTHPLSELLCVMSYYYMDDFLLIGNPSNAPRDISINRNVILLVDVSKSMYDGKHIDSAKTDLKKFITTEGARTEISLITFGSRVEIKSRSTVFTSEKVIDSLIATFQDGSATNIDKAIATAYVLADSTTNSEIPTTIVLFSDAGFELSHSVARKIKKDEKKKNIAFVVYHYGKRENKNLEKNVKKWNGIYAEAKKVSIASIVPKKKSGYVGCNCNCK
jgi:uncharacterized protein YegL